jgi:hypothetical protein
MQADTRKLCAAPEFRARSVTCDVPASDVRQQRLVTLDSLLSRHLGEFWDTGERQGAQSGHASRISRIAG